MNKTVKIISTLLLAVLLITTASQTVLATDNNVTGDFGDYKNIIESVNQNAKGDSSDVSGIKGVASRVVKAIRNIAAIIAVVIISILGIKYMIGSTQERADYKKSFIPLIVGIIVVVAAAQIATMIFSVAAN